ncbi:sulfurtransferase TusA family protein [Alkalihalobacillus sp. 1P02AB]|uniref:sulfurtransferase TusA family protein n=1 Tax=Alkalihalobacillus sp. 1P02AB TaxID=3132260 RepID=UPI0039A4BBFC
MKHDIFVDAKGLACPMPIVRTKKAMNDIEPGLIVEMQSTDQGSTADLKAWAQKAGHQYVGTIEEGTTLKHYLRSGGDKEEEHTFPHIIHNEDLKRVINNREALTILDVREKNEFDEYHIPSAVSIPMGELEKRVSELDKEKPIYVVCRTGNRSDMAAHLLVKSGYKRVVNVVPGMNKWKEEGGN